MIRGRHLALQLARRGLFSSRRSGLGFNEEFLRSGVKHLVARDIRIGTPIEENISKYGGNRVFGSEDCQWQKRCISSLEQADEQKAPANSRSDGNVGVQGQPPLSQPLDGDLKPTSEEEDRIAPVLARSDLLITRNVEWANLALGFEQQNKYVIMDPLQPQAPVGFIVEESNVVLRQILKGRRPFIVSVLDANGEEVCRVRRPAFFINSSMFVEIDGKVIGECHQRWHLWKRIYDVYMGNKQFATVENPGFWNWTFTLTDDSGGILAEIDRNWRGFGFEFLTDAGQYVVRFGDILPKGSIQTATPELENAEDRKPLLLSKGETTGGAEMQQLREAAEKVDALAVARPLSLTERAVTLALAVSLDNDYFSRHSQSGVGMPLPIPFYTSEAAETSAEDSPAASSSADHETGHEVFPSQGYQGSQSDNTAGNPEVLSDTKDDTFADDPYFGMFDEQPGGGADQNNNNDNQFFDDTTPDSGDAWGLNDWFDGDNN